MNAEFFALAFTAALNPKLLALDLLLIENRRPRAMFLWVLLGGMTVAVTIGLLDVLTVHAVAISSPGKASAGVDLALGLLLLVAGGLLATGRLHGRQRASVPARRLQGAGPGPSCRPARRPCSPGRPGPNPAGDRQLAGTRSQRLILRFHDRGRTDYPPRTQDLGPHATVLPDHSRDQRSRHRGAVCNSAGYAALTTARGGVVAVQF